MSIDQTSVVDFVSTNKENEVVLTVSDHLEWDEKNEHLHLLQEKINAYLRFIESGEIYEEYPDAKGKKIIISVHAKFQPNEDGQTLISKMTEAVRAAGYEFQFEQASNTENNID